MKDLWKSSTWDVQSRLLTLKADSLNLGIAALEEWIIVLWAECQYSSHDPLAQVLAKQLQRVQQQPWHSESPATLDFQEAECWWYRGWRTAPWQSRWCALHARRRAMALHKQTEKLKWQDKSARDNFLPISLAKFGGRVVLMPLASQQECTNVFEHNQSQRLWGPNWATSVKILNSHTLNPIIPKLLILILSVDRTASTNTWVQERSSQCFIK